ncbi:MAG: VWA domain-containing protein [Pyrinomonadaceae bacterium]
MQFFRRNFASLVFLVFSPAIGISAQIFTREIPVNAGGTVEIINRSGRVDVTAEIKQDREEVEPKAGKLSITAKSQLSIAETEVKIDSASGKVCITVEAAGTSKRIDLSLIVPERLKVKIETLEGEARVSGNLESIEVKTETGTIAADVPTEALKYSLIWTESRPRFLSDFDIEKVKEKSGGKFEIKGRYQPEKSPKSEPTAAAAGSTSEENGEQDEDENPKPKTQKPQTISLNLTTARGIILLNVPPNEVSSDLRERPLTNAAKAIIRSGDSLLMEAIRRTAPEYFGDYARTLPPVKREPSFADKASSVDVPQSSIKRASVRVTDLQNRTISGLKAGDFTITENNEPREILEIQPATAPVNLVLLLDVSGSVDNYVNFIRKAARSFVDTVGKNDRLSIVIFNDDVKVLSKFTTDKAALSESLDTFDAGGSTAFYDSLAYTLTDTLRPLKGERTAIVILTDGDDNRSFLPFESLIGSIQESGALIYPLYVPSALIASSVNSDPNAAIDPLRTRYNGLTSKAEGEGDRLAKVSGGVYYPITQLSQIQAAYDDIATQLRSGYVVTFRSQIAGNGASPRLKIRTKKDNAFVSVVSVVGGQ